MTVAEPERPCYYCGHSLNEPSPKCGKPQLHDRRVESDTSSNARPDTADDGTYWPESTHARCPD